MVPSPSVVLVTIAVLMLTCLLGIHGVTAAPGGNDHLAAPPAITDVVRVNVMAMNFPAAGPWADAVTAAGEATVRRLGEVWPGADPAELRRRVGVTVMIGRNDQGMVTTLADAQAVARTARERGFGAVGMWSVARDDGCPLQEIAQPDWFAAT